MACSSLQIDTACSTSTTYSSYPSSSSRRSITGVLSSNSVYDNTGGHIGLRSHRYEHLCFELSHHLANYDRRRDAEALYQGSIKALLRLY
jgi:hypothetical protein